MVISRFDYAANLPHAGSYRSFRGAQWPPDGRDATAALLLDDECPDLGEDARGALGDLMRSIEAEWRDAIDGAVTKWVPLRNPEPVADAMERIATALPRLDDRRATLLRAAAVREGYTPETLAALRELDEDVTVVAGRLSTWYGKEAGGLPTAFACRVDPVRQRAVDAALGAVGAVPAYLAELHQGLRLGDLPAFGATRLFAMAGEGDRHPKHIAYFLPEDEGVKRSPFKKTYYFANTHLALLKASSAPLATRVLDVGEPFRAEDPDDELVSTLGVFGHECGHSVSRETTRYRPLNAEHRWASVLLQEVCADVFGALVLVEQWARPAGLDPHTAVSYYLAECLRYVNRGLGYFPDSDGMYLQLSYLIEVGALEVTDSGTLRGDPEAVVAGLRSLARVLADAVLDGNAEHALTLHATFGPPSRGPLTAVLERIADVTPASIDYTGQDLPHRAPVGALLTAAFSEDVRVMAAAGVGDG